MQIFYPYNEILPKRSAHDVYIFHNCSALHKAGTIITLACGYGSLSVSNLIAHYQSTATNLSIKFLPIIRKNYGLPFTWNRLFFSACQYYIQQQNPNWVICSVLKQGLFHVKHKTLGVKYAYEVHELGWYPNIEINNKKIALRIKEEKELFNKMDLITVTTDALANILKSPPYLVNTPITVIPLAQPEIDPLPAPIYDHILKLVYIGQLYNSQGLDLLIDAVSQLNNVELNVVGGNALEVATYQQKIDSYNIQNRVFLHGFHPPSTLIQFAKYAHVFVAPFTDKGRMPYVAHTKLAEYIAWGRPVIAPDLPVVNELFINEAGLISFPANSITGLIQAIKKCRDDRVFLEEKYQQIKKLPRYNWEIRTIEYLHILHKIAET